MAGNKNPWRDVYSPDAWIKILELTAADPTATVLDSNNKDLLLAIGRALLDYDRLDKRDPTAIDARINGLAAIETAAATYLQTKHQNLQKPNPNTHKGKERSGLQLVMKKVEEGKALSPTLAAKLISPVPEEKTIDRWIYSLYRRAVKKKDYLNILKLHLPANKSNINSALNFMKFAEKRQSTPPAFPELLQLDPGVSAEQWDPYHRAIEVNLADVSDPRKAHNLISQAFLEWLASGINLHFLIWLEGHPICTFSKYVDDWTAGQGRVPLDIRMVQYGPTTAIKQVWIKNGALVACPMLSASAQTPTPFSASQAPPKLGHAFVWLKTGEILVHPHNPGVFHHSSFTQGGAVRCAGTILAVNGKVTRLDNNSGHYKPSDQHFLTFFNFLSKENVIAHDAKIGTHVLTGKGHSAVNVVPVADFRSAVKDNNKKGFIVTTGEVPRMFL